MMEERTNQKTQVASFEAVHSPFLLTTFGAPSVIGISLISDPMILVFGLLFRPGAFGIIVLCTIDLWMMNIQIRSSEVFILRSKHVLVFIQPPQTRHRQP